MQVLLWCNKDGMFRRGDDGQGAAFHFVNVRWFENVEVVTVQQVMCLGKPEVYRNDKKSNGRQSAVDHVQVYLDMTTSTMKHRVFEIYSVHAFAAQFKRGIQREYYLQWTYYGVTPTC